MWPSGYMLTAQVAELLSVDNSFAKSLFVNNIYYKSMFFKSIQAVRHWQQVMFLPWVGQHLGNMFLMFKRRGETNVGCALGNKRSSYFTIAMSPLLTKHVAIYSHHMSIIRYLLITYVFLSLSVNNTCYRVAIC